MPTAPMPEEDIPPLVFEIRFPDSPGCEVDLTEVACARLIRDLATALRQLAQVGGRISARPTVYVYVNALKKLDAFVAARNAQPDQLELSELAPSLLDAFEEHLYTEIPVDRTAYGFLGALVAMLRHVRDTDPDRLHPQMPLRLRFIGHRRYPRPRPGLDAYPPEVVAALRAACREHLRAAVTRITVTGERLLAAGVDPRVGGWDVEANLLWEIERCGALSDAEFTRAAGRTVRRGVSLMRLHELLYPTEMDLAAAAILLILDTGLEPEAVRALRADCLRNPAHSFVEIDYLKRRRHSEEHNRLRVRDGNATIPGGLVRLVLRLTRRARVHVAGSAALWISYQGKGNGRLAVSKVPVRDYSGAATLAQRSGLIENGRPLSIDFRRLRKSYKAEFYRATGGQLPLLARGHSNEVAAARYADIPALRDIHEGAIVDGLTEALTDAVQLRVLTADDEQHLTAHPEQAPQVAGVDAGQLGSLLAGEKDLWLSACRDFTDSPFAAKGTPCPVPFWTCLDCSNAIVTSRTLPAILAFLDHLHAQREQMPADAWEAVHGGTWRRIHTQILPAFPADVVTMAKAIAESEAPLRHLPPRAGGIGARE
ncbi:hypothetical protein [Rhodococcus sp. MTM3W5.2]|uniref:hypothetical protein n=1 Tax=Rhodococcus sp. MTM3W5.2 TaxID=1805827 RepID=UPI0011AE63B2|nr:hypothetical protein [Rhodococcus sp. MTM3W5.2]